MKKVIEFKSKESTTTKPYGGHERNGKKINKLVIHIPEKEEEPPLIIHMPESIERDFVSHTYQRYQMYERYQSDEDSDSEADSEGDTPMLGAPNSPRTPATPGFFSIPRVFEGEPLDLGPPMQQQDLLRANTALTNYVNSIIDDSRR